MGCLLGLMVFLTSALASAGTTALERLLPAQEDGDAGADYAEALSLMSSDGPKCASADDSERCGAAAAALARGMRRKNNTVADRLFEPSRQGGLAAEIERNYRIASMSLYAGALLAKDLDACRKDCRGDEARLTASRMIAFGNHLMMAEHDAAIVMGALTILKGVRTMALWDKLSGSVAPRAEIEQVFREVKGRFFKPADLRYVLFAVRDPGRLPHLRRCLERPEFRHLYANVILRYGAFAWSESEFETGEPSPQRMELFAYARSRSIPRVKAMAGGGEDILSEVQSSLRREGKIRYVKALKETFEEDAESLLEAAETVYRATPCY